MFCSRGNFGVHYKQSELQLVFRRRSVLRRRIVRVVRRTVVLRLLPKPMVDLRFIHNLRYDVSDHVDHRRVSKKKNKKKYVCAHHQDRLESE